MSEAHSKYVEGFLQIQIGIATLGASITFALILTPLNPPPAPYDSETVQTLLAVSWLLFVVGLLLACIAASVLYCLRHLMEILSHTSADTREKLEKFWFWVLQGFSKIAITYLVLLGVLYPLAVAVLFLSVVVWVYTGTVGLISICFISVLFGILHLIGLMYVLIGVIRLYMRFRHWWARRLIGSPV